MEKVIASELRARVADESGTGAARAMGFAPGLAVVLVGNDPAQRGPMSAASTSRRKPPAWRRSSMCWPADVAQNDLLALIGELNRDSSVHGILVQFAAAEIA